MISERATARKTGLRRKAIQSLPLKSRCLVSLEMGPRSQVLSTFSPSDQTGACSSTINLAAVVRASVHTGPSYQAMLVVPELFPQHPLKGVAVFGSITDGWNWLTPACSPQIVRRLEHLNGLGNASARYDRFAKTPTEFGPRGCGEPARRLGGPPNRRLEAIYRPHELRARAAPEMFE